MLYSTDKPVKFLLRSLFLIIFSLALLNCGGSSDGDGANANGDNGNPTGDNPDPGFSDAVSGVTPVTPLSRLSTVNQDLLGFQLTVDGGSEGDIEVVAGNGSGTAAPNLRLVTDGDSDEFESAGPRLQLVNGVSSINIIDVRRTFAADFSCEDDTTIKVVISANFVSGIVNSTGMINGQMLSCSSTFQTVLETTVTDMSIKELLEDWGSNDDDSRTTEETGLKSTNCPQDEDSFDQFKPRTCVGNLLTNYIVTDINNGVHKVSTKISFTSTGSGDIFDSLFEQCLEEGGTEEACRQAFK